ncbi:MAG: DNA primase [Bdellovibrionota bacterium]
MKFSQDFIDRVSEANNLVEIIGQHTILKPSGRGLMGRCPFPDHVEKTPSFSVSEEKQVYHCFGCGKSGNLFTFLRDQQGMGFAEAVEFLAERARIELPRTETNDREELENRKKKNITQANLLAAQFFRRQFLESPEAAHARAYAESRGLLPETLETFKVGYAPQEWSKLTEELQREKIPSEVALQAHLIRAKQSGTGFFDLFRDRLMFPISNKRGDVVAFGGRIINEGTPKYLNSPETPVFQKSRILYGLNETARFIRSEDRAIIVEGYMDLVSLFQAGLKPVVAIMGTAMTEDHAHQLKNLTKNIYLLLDGDQAGITAAERSLPILLKAGFHPKGIILPQELDPDDFVKKYGLDTLENELLKASDLFVLIMNRWIGNKNLGQTDKIAILDRLAPLLISVTDRRLQDLYLKTVASRLSLEPQWVREALRGTSSSASSGPRTSTTSAKNFSSSTNVPNQNVNAISTGENAVKESVFKLSKATKAEASLVAYALKSRANMNYFLEEKALSLMSEGDAKKLFQEILDADRQAPERFDRLVSQFVNKVDKPHLLFVEDEENENGSVGILTMIVKRLKENHLREELKSLAQDLQLQESPEKWERLKQIQIEITLLSKSAKGAV